MLISFLKTVGTFVGLAAVLAIVAGIVIVVTVFPGGWVLRSFGETSLKVYAVGSILVIALVLTAVTR
jgi:hypothetical protein